MADILTTSTYSGLILLAENGDAAAPTAGGGIASFLPFLLVGALFYLLLIRPQKKKQKNQQAMVSALGLGDDVVTIGGIYGEIVGVSEDTIDLEVADGLTITMARAAISKAQSEPTPIDLDDDLDDDFDDDFDDDDFDDDFNRDDEFDDTSDSGTDR